MRIDLHIHTTATAHHSSWAPDALVAAARARGLGAIAATDHNTLAALGLDGIEVFYPSHTDAQRTALLQWAGELGLLVSGGSDSHHPHQPLAAWEHPALAPLLRRLVPP